MPAYDPFGNRTYGNDAASNPYPGRERSISGQVGWGGMGASNSNVDPFTGRSLPNPNLESTRLRASQNRPNAPSTSVTDPNPGFVPSQFRVAAGGTVNPQTGAYIPPGSPSNGGSSTVTSTPTASPFPSGGMNPNPTSVQQFRWAVGGGPGSGQLNAAAADGPLAPEYANMQGAVQAGIDRNQNTRPSNYSLATNNPGVWIDPTTGGTWSAPGVGSYNSWEVFGTDPSNPNSPYKLPSGTYNANRQTGAVTLAGLQGH